MVISDADDLVTEVPRAAGAYLGPLIPPPRWRHRHRRSSLALSRSSLSLSVSLARPLSKQVRLRAHTTHTHTGTLDLDGALEVRAAAGTKVIIKKLEVRNKGWQIEASGDSDDPVTSMRGFTIVKHESKIVSAAGVAEHVIDE